MFDALGISASAMRVHQTWMDALSDNIANINTVRPTNSQAFRARYVVAAAQENGSTGSGVAVAGIELGSAAGRVAYDPDNPLADGRGMVRLPDIDLGEQMASMILAQRGYQANVANLDRVRATYQAAIAMGRG